MSNIAQIQSSDTFDFQRKRINDAIDIVNSMGGGIAELETEANLPDPSAAASNIYLIRNHSKFKGAALAALINGVYKITPLKNDVINSNQFIYVDDAKLASSVTINKCVYLDSTGVWQLADPSNPNKYAQGIVGPYNSIILGGILYSSSLNLSVGATYYYDNNGNLTLAPTIGKVGVAIDANTLSLHFLSINTDVQDKETAVNYNHITNCITHIPQNIKLELADGVLTLKAGSKGYVPNGAGVFDEITISSNKTLTNTTNGTYVVCISSGGGMVQRDISKCVSGTTRSLTTTYMLWYDTINNVINNYGSDSATPAQIVSLPIAIITVSDGNISSIDQIFNGFSYIGSTVFVLPGVKGLIPNGINGDGTLNNKNFTVPNVFTSTITTGSYSGIFVLATTGVSVASSASGFRYDPERNVIYAQSNGTIYSDRIIAGFRSVSNGKIESLTPKTAFHAVDYNDFEDITRVVSKANNGLVPQLPNETTIKKFLRQDGVWAEPPESILKSGGAMTGTLSDVSAAQVRNIVILSEEQDTGVDGTIYMVIEEY